MVILSTYLYAVKPTAPKINLGLRHVICQQNIDTETKDRGYGIKKLMFSVVLKR